MLFLPAGCLLWDSEWHVGKEWPADQGAGHDIHPVPLLQLHGGRWPLPSADLCWGTSCWQLYPHCIRSVRKVLFLFFLFLMSFCSYLCCIYLVILSDMLLFLHVLWCLFPLYFFTFLLLLHFHLYSCPLWHVYCRSPLTQVGYQQNHSFKKYKIYLSYEVAFFPTPFLQVSCAGVFECVPKGIQQLPGLWARDDHPGILPHFSCHTCDCSH